MNWIELNLSFSLKIRGLPKMKEILCFCDIPLRVLGNSPSKSTFFYHIFNNHASCWSDVTLLSLEYFSWMCLNLNQFKCPTLFLQIWNYHGERIHAIAFVYREKKWKEITLVAGMKNNLNPNGPFYGILTGDKHIHFLQIVISQKHNVRIYPLSQATMFAKSTSRNVSKKNNWADKGNVTRRKVCFYISKTVNFVGVEELWRALPFFQSSTEIGIFLSILSDSSYRKIDESCE